MRVSTLLRSGPAIWSALVLIPVLAWSTALNSGFTIAYWPSVSSRATGVLGFVSAACGAGAAWEAARVRQGGITGLAPARGPSSVAFLHLGPVALLGLLAVATPVGVVLTSVAPPPGLPNPAVLAASYSVILAHIALGWFVGARTPQLLGVASLLVFGYLWGFWPAALGGLPWLRHLNGQGVNECCGLDQEPSMRSLAATVTFSLAIVTAVVLGSSARSRRRALLLSLTGFVVPTAVALSFAVPLGFHGTDDRDSALRTCTGRSPRICLWPEQDTERAEIGHWAEETTARLATVGVVPARQVEFGNPRPARTDVVSTIATSLLPDEAPACALRDGAAYPGGDAVTALSAWLSLTGGVPESDLVRRWPSTSIALARQISVLPAEEQHAWYERNMRSVRDCSVLPDLRAASSTQAAAS
ncbi:hypothetical protein OG786_22000 [Streptomyces sp. NBC_00101]|uniref:DUF7224 domain-containing protein n=1 Tax=Streptomyces sp. NBC_00101 TaxID=2975651 RepID=UPI003243CC54